MTELLKALLFGIVEGVTEWLPVSSTGHMILLNELVSLRVSAMFMQMFLVVIQLGAIMAVVILYWNTIWPFKKDRETGKIRVNRETISLWGKTIVACLPAAVVGVLADDWLEVHFYNWFVVSVMLIAVGIAFIVVENRNYGKKPVTRRLRDLTYREALIIGLFQLIAAICAAPAVLNEAGILEGRTWTCYPGVADQISAGTYTAEKFVIDGSLLTAKGPAMAWAFAYKIADLLGADSLSVKKRMVYFNAFDVKEDE